MTVRNKTTFIFPGTETLLEIGGSPKGLRFLSKNLEEPFGDVEFQLLGGKRSYGQINTRDTGDDLSEGGRETIKDSVIVRITEKGQTREVALIKLKEGIPSYLLHGEKENKREQIGIPNPKIGTFYIALLKANYYKGKLESVIVAPELDH